MMFFDHAAHDGQAESSTALSGGKIWQEQSLLQLGSYSMAGVCDADFHGLPAGRQGSRNLNLADHRGLQRLGCVVDQVRDRTFDRFEVSHYLGKIRRKRLMNMDSVQSSI